MDSEDQYEHIPISIIDIDEIIKAYGFDDDHPDYAEIKSVLSKSIFG